MKLTRPAPHSRYHPIATALALGAAGVLLSAALLVTAPVAHAKFGFVTKWGTPGSGNGHFLSPEGIATDAAGNVYVADTYLDRIQKFTANGAFITRWGSDGFANGRFDNPEDVATDAAGNIYVADSGNDRIQKFTANGAFITKWGSPGNGNGQFHAPAGVATDGAGNVYVSDYGNNRIQKFTPNGAFITKWGSYGVFANGQFYGPNGIATDAAGNVYVADYLNDRIQKFTANGAFITKWGGARGGGDDPANGQLYRPIDLATDAAGNVYVADSGNARIQKFTANGAFITKWGSVGSSNGHFFHMNGIGTDAAGNVYVTDDNTEAASGPARIQKFGPVPVVRITQGPKSPTSNREATFKFRSDEPGTRFRCRLDDGEWSPCSSPHRVRGLATGKHVFRVRGRVAGNAGKPARWAWKVTR